MHTSEVDNEFDVGKMSDEGKIPGIVTGLQLFTYLDDDRLSMDSQLKSAMISSLSVGYNNERTHLASYFGLLTSYG